MGAACGCAGGSPFDGPELDEWLEPYLDTWVVEARGGRDRVKILNEQFPWGPRQRLLFYKDGDTSVTSGFTVSTGGRDRYVGAVVGRQAVKKLTFGKSPSGEVYWDSFGSHCLIALGPDNPDKFTMQVQYGFAEPKTTLVFERETPSASKVLASDYSGRHIVGISGRAGANVDQLTLHYSDGTTKTQGKPGGGDVPPQMFDPAVDGHIIMVEWDEMPHYLGGGFRFHLSGGKVITLDGGECRWRQGEMRSTRSFKGPPPPEENSGAAVAPYALLDLTWGQVGSAYYPKGSVWQALPTAGARAATAAAPAAAAPVAASSEGGLAAFFAPRA